MSAVTAHPSQAQGAPASRFAVRFCLWLLVWSFLFWLLDLHLRLVFLQRILAWAGMWFDHIMGGSAQVRDISIVLGPMTLDVNHECTGVFLLMVFASFVLAYPATRRAKLIALAVGLPALQFVNAVRLGVLGRLVEVYPEAFFYFHEYVWQGVFMALVLLGCMAWAERAEQA